MCSSREFVLLLLAAFVAGSGTTPASTVPLVLPWQDAAAGRAQALEARQERGALLWIRRDCSGAESHLMSACVHNRLRATCCPSSCSSCARSRSWVVCKPSSKRVSPRSIVRQFLARITHVSVFRLAAMTIQRSLWRLVTYRRNAVHVLSRQWAVHEQKMVFPCTHSPSRPRPNLQLSHFGLIWALPDPPVQGGGRQARCRQAETAWALGYGSGCFLLAACLIWLQLG